MQINGCCSNMEFTTYKTYIEIDNHTFCVTISYCKSCGSLKSTTNIQQVRK